MSKAPFRVAGQEQRDSAGRYAERYHQPRPAEIVRKSPEDPLGMTGVLSKPENRAMDHDSVGGRPGAPQEPWGPAQPATSRPPMRLRQ